MTFKMYVWASLTSGKICFLKETFVFNYKHFSMYLLKYQFFQHNYYTIITRKILIKNVLTS